MDFEYDNTHFSNDIELDDVTDETQSHDVNHMHFIGDNANCFTVDPNSNIDFNSVEWEYLQIAQESLHKQQQQQRQHPHHKHHHHNTSQSSG